MTLKDWGCLITGFLVAMGIRPSVIENNVMIGGETELTDWYFVRPILGLKSFEPSMYTVGGLTMEFKDL